MLFEYLLVSLSLKSSWWCFFR